MNRLLLAFVTLASCTRSEPTSVTSTATAPRVWSVPPPVILPDPAPTITVDLTSVTLADACGGTAPLAPPAQAKRRPEPAAGAPSRNDAARSRGARAAARRCEQTSMQLTVTSPKGAKPTTLKIKKVELFDDAGKSLGVLAASSPTRWSAKGAYQAWDQKLGGGEQASVSYVLAQPKWDHIANRWNRSYTLKVTATVGSDDQALQKAVHVSSPPTSLPPNVRT
ncbi:MAG: hypothetical protein WKG01_11930 [Kofleriaceae bacterium]